MKIATVIVLSSIALGPLQAPQLQLGKVVEGATDEPGASYAFRAEAAGVLTVVVRGMEEGDLMLRVADEDGQPLFGGHADTELGGDNTAEQMAFTIPRAGVYRVNVVSFDDRNVRFRIGASWVEFPALEVPPDPDGAPGRATVLTTERRSIEDSLNGAAGDHWDWFVITVDEAGSLTVATRGEDGDLALEMYRPGAFGEPAERSDQDLQDSLANEALTLTVAAGDKLCFKVVDIGSGELMAYRLQVSFFPD